MDELDLALLEAFLNSHANGARGEWFDPAHPEYFDEWAHGAAAADGVQDGDEALAAETGRRIAVLAGAPATVADIAQVRDIRDALMATILDGSAPESLDALLVGLPVRLRARGMLQLEPAGRGALAVATAAVIAAYRITVAGEWPRLHLCRGDDCHWAFFDRSKNRSRVWCDMSACGARSKARTYRERQRGA